MKIELNIGKAEAAFLLETLFLESHRLKNLEYSEDQNREKAATLIGIAVDLQRQGVNLLDIVP